MLSLNRLGALILAINRQGFRVSVGNEVSVTGKELKQLTKGINDQNNRFFNIFQEVSFIFSEFLKGGSVTVLKFLGVEEPNPSQPGNGIIYFDSTENRFRASEDGLKYFDAFPREGCRVYNTANISVNNNTVTALTFDTERFDPFSMFTLGGSQIVIVRSGRYNLGGVIEFDDANNGYRELCVRMNGTTNLVATNKLPNGAGVANDKMNVACDYEFVAGDYIELTVYQNSGGALNVIATGNASPEFWCARVHDQPV